MKKILSLTFLMCGLLNTNLNFAQVSNYSFNSSSGTYTAITGTQLIASGADDVNSTVLNIGFDFVFNGTTFTQFVANSNGCIRLGSSAPGTPFTAISTTSNTNTIAFYARDGKTGDAVVYELTGTSPNRILTIQYSNWYPIYNSTSLTLNAQIKLYETSNIVQFVYGNSTASSSTIGQVGLRGSTTTTDYSSRSSSTNWNASIASSSSSSTMTLSSTVKPTSGLIYEWSPPQPCVTPTDQPTNLTFSSVSSSSISASFTAANAAPSGYLVVRSTSSTPPTPTDGATYATGSTSLGAGTNVISSGSSTTFNSSSLTSNTTYYYHVFSYNNSGCSGGPVYNISTPLVGSVTTCLSGTPSTPTLSNETTNSMQVSWSAFTGATSYRLDVSTSSSFTSYVTGYQDLVINGTTYSITGLTSNTTYYVRIRAHNESCPSSNSNNASRTTLKIEPINQPTNFVAGTVTTSNIPLSWTAALAGSQGPDGYLIKGSATSLAAITDPVDGTDTGNATSFSSGSANVKTTGSSYNSFTNQAAGTMYYYKMYSYSNATTSSTTSTTIDYKTDNVPSLYHATLPVANTTPVFSNITSNATTISWTQPATYSNSSHSTLVFVKAGSAVTVGTPSLAPSHYSADSIFALGTPYQGDANAYCVYSGDATNVSVAGLMGNTTYHFFIITVVDATNSNGNNSYSTALTSNKTTLCNPVDSFTITFEESSSLPSCTSFLSTDGLGANVNTTYPYQGIRCLGLQNATTYILPKVTNGHLNTHAINFYGRTFSGTGQIGFGYLIDPSDAATYVNLQTFNLTTTYQYCTFNPVDIPQNASLAIKLLSSSVLRIDNIVWEPKPSVIWSSQTWSNTTGPTSSDNADIDDDLTTTSDLNCKDLTINSGKTLTIASGHSLNISGNLVNNGQIIFKSDATSTGRFDSYTGNAITGSGTVTMERYIDGKRAYRLLAPGLTTTGTIANNWQQQVFITGSTTGANGFDATTTGNPSMYTYENSGWAPISNTNVLTLDATKGYRMLIRGDRTPSLLTSPSEANMNTAVTLTATGSLVTGDVIFTTLPSQDYTLVGNPYVSPIDWATVTKNDIAPTYYVWDPNLGTVGQRGRYVSCDEAGLTSIVSGSGGPSSAVNIFIQPGQAFFIEKAVSGTPGSITVKETDKAATFTDVFRTNSAPTTTTIEGKLGMNLYESLAYSLGDYPIDGAVAVSGTVFNTASANDDAKKLMSHGEQVAFVRENKQLGVEKVSPPQLNDVLTLATLNLVPNKNYVWSVVLQDDFSNENSYLYDAFTQTYHSLTASGTTVVSFATTADVASTQVNRFKIVFQTSVLSAPDFTNEIVVYPNPAKVQNAVCYVKGISNATVALHNVLGQNIPIQTTTDGTTLTLRPTVALNKGIYVVHIAQDGTIKQVKWIVD